MSARVMEDISQVLYKGDSMTIAHQCTTSTSPNPLACGPQRRDVTRCSAFPLPPFASSGHEFALDTSACSIIAWRKCMMKGSPCPLFIFVRLPFCLSSLRHLGLPFLTFLSFSSPCFKSSCVYPGPPTPSSPELPPYFRLLLTPCPISTCPTPSHARARFGRRRDNVYA